MGQGGAAAAAAGQQFDQLPVTRLVQRIDGQLPPGVALGRGKILVGQVDGRQPLQDQQDAAPVRLAPGRGPLLERVAVGQVKVGQEVAAIEGDGLLQLAQPRPDAVDEGGEAPGVDDDGRGRVELQRVAVGQDERHGRLTADSGHFRNGPP